MKKRLMISVLLAVPAVASAKDFLGSGSHDCSKDPVVNINAGSATITLTGACKTVNVNGGSNKLAAASIGTLNLNGADNTADCDELGGVNLTGTGNKVTYKKAQKGDKPSWRAIGAGNTLTKGAGKPADKPADKSPPPGDDNDDDEDDKAGGETAPANAKVIDCAKTPTWSHGNGGGKFKFTGKCTKISLGGGGNSLWIQSVDKLDLGGGDNKLFIEWGDTLVIGGADNSIVIGTVGTIDVGGTDNTVTWKKAIKGAGPTLKGQPKKNKIVQAR